MSTPSNEPVAETPVVVSEAPVEVTAEAAVWPASASPRLVCQRGAKVGIEYPIYEGKNFMGRSDEQPVDIDLEDQETPEHVWSSRQHCCITFENGTMTIDDLKSANGTYVNRDKLIPGEPRTLKPDDMVQVGAIHLRLKA